MRPTLFVNLTKICTLYAADGGKGAAGAAAHGRGIGSERERESLGWYLRSLACECAARDNIVQMKSGERANLARLLEVETLIGTYRAAAARPPCRDAVHGVVR